MKLRRDETYIVRLVTVFREGKLMELNLYLHVYVHILTDKFLVWPLFSYMLAYNTAWV